MPDIQMIDPSETITFSIVASGMEEPIHQFMMTGEQMRQVPDYGKAAIAHFRDNMELDSDDAEICELILSHTIQSGDHQADEAQDTFTALVAYMAYLWEMDLTQDEVVLTVIPNGDGLSLTPGSESLLEFIVSNQGEDEPVCHFTIQTSQIPHALPVGEQQVSGIMEGDEVFMEAGKKATCESMLIHLFSSGEHNEPDNRVMTSALVIYWANENQADLTGGQIPILLKKNEQSFSGYDFAVATT
jgi:hypothetical protein